MCFGLRKRLSNFTRQKKKKQLSQLNNNKYIKIKFSFNEITPKTTTNLSLIKKEKKKDRKKLIRSRSIRTNTTQYVVLKVFVHKIMV